MFLIEAAIPALSRQGKANAGLLCHARAGIVTKVDNGDPHCAGEMQSHRKGPKSCPSSRPTF